MPLLKAMEIIEPITIIKTQKCLERRCLSMSAMQPQPNLLTLTQYEALPEEQRVEVFDGIAYAMASPSEVHQTILLEFSTLLNLYLKSKKGSCRVFPAPFEVKLSDSPLTIVQPDLMIICDKNKLDGKRCNGAPDFIIEIVSPGNPADDYIRKLYYYKNAGVREYWIIDPRRKIVTVNYFEKNILDSHYPFDAVIKVNIYEDLYIDFSDIAELL
jgi:Uma2 family endonuclease